jgi:hypothetical protein
MNAINKPIPKHATPLDAANNPPWYRELSRRFSFEDITYPAMASTHAAHKTSPNAVRLAELVGSKTSSGIFSPVITAVHQENNYSVQLTNFTNTTMRLAAHMAMHIVERARIYSGVPRSTSSCPRMYALRNIMYAVPIAMPLDSTLGIDIGLANWSESFAI